tara:strand:+ start:479 stop:709 length:231 start_codon:yes stop_codon:yes gene_type:complete
MNKVCKIGDLIILKDFDEYLGSERYKNPSTPCVGLITQISCSSAYVQWIDDHLSTWEKQDNVLIISKAIFITSSKT